MPRPALSVRAGFTLLELLVVVGIIGVMTGLVIPAFSSIGQSGALNSAGNEMADLMGLARQNSLSKNGMSAIVLVTNTSTREQVVSVMQLLPRQDDQPLQSSDWTAITGWIPLPAGVFADVSPSDPGTCTTFQNASNGAPVSSGPPLPYVSIGGMQPATYKYALFCSGGSLLSASNAMLFLSNGHVDPPTGNAVFTPPILSGSSYPGNYYRLTVVAATGRVEIDRP
ncbi:MAG TPA: prepilin-type N-terminal cleavage/methylation domain-containing protein [Chthoniobacteraceae bacterium]|nr:prepilin-type N-terminal cleavage/methylation domain-containing protein [Chthoniobacteraceae bacterium]